VRIAITLLVSGPEDDDAAQGGGRTRAARRQRVPVAGDGAALPLLARRRRVPRGLHPAAAEPDAGLAPGGRPGVRRAAMGVLDRHVHVPVRQGVRRRAPDGRRGAGRQQHALARRLVSY
jgi:hypothetical protein